MLIYQNTDIEKLANKFIKDILSKENFSISSAKGGFLTGGNVIICESKGLQEYLQKKCVDICGIWTALPFKPLAGLLMQCAYNLSAKENKKDEKENIYNANNLIWAVYSLLEGKEKTFTFANEIASLFSAYQIYRPKLIEQWKKNEAYIIKDADDNFIKNEKWQRELWHKLKSEFKNEQNISELYKVIENKLKELGGENRFLPKRIFIFAPISIAPIHILTLKLLANAGCKVNLYLFQISNEYIGYHLPDKKIAKLRKESWAKNKIVNEEELYWDLGNRLIANLGRCSQVLYEQILENHELGNEIENIDIVPKTLLAKIQNDIINDSHEDNSHKIKDATLVLNNCFSPLREIEVLCDYIIGLFEAKKDLTPADIAIVSPNIENYASAIESIFGRYGIPFRIADRDIKKSSKTAQLLNLLFSQIGNRYEAPDILALFEYSMYVQGRELTLNDRDILEKWIRENAIRHGLESSNPFPNYSFESGFEQLAAGFFMISENGFSENGDYCYPDIEGSSARILGDFIYFVRTLKQIEVESKKEQSIKDWDYFFTKNLQVFFGTDETNFNEDKDNPYQKIINAWDALKEEILTGFKNNVDTLLDFSVIRSALPRKLEANAKSSYSMSGVVSFSNYETVRAIPHKIICCIGMNGKEFPRQVRNKEISLMAKYERGDKDAVNEDRQMFLESILSAKESLYISWVGQDEKNADELEPSSVVVMLLKNLEKQYGINVKDLIVKHPLQPFSEKYFNGKLITYDARWNEQRRDKKNIWEWEGNLQEQEEKRDIDALYRILSDAPKYFLRTVCNIELPAQADLLESIEPFTIEKRLGEWSLKDLILSKEDYKQEIEIQQIRGNLPSGKFADKAIESIEKTTEELKERAKGEISGTYWIYPGKDKGKYRLKHWLKHLELNRENENQDTKMFLEDKEITLAGIPKAKAEEILDKLWSLKQELEKRMLPIFPNAAYTYITAKKEKIKAAEKSLFDNRFYSQYTKMLLDHAESLKKLGIKDEFIECSERLFENYKVKNEKTCCE
jgi:exodeoxyribonuclease V gamma subunit